MVKVNEGNAFEISSSSKPVNPSVSVTDSGFVKWLRPLETQRQKCSEWAVFFKVNVMQECKAKNSLGSLTWKHVRGLKITSSGKVNSQ